MRDSRQIPRPYKSNGHNDDDHDATYNLVQAYISPDIKQLMSTCVLTSGMIYKIATAIAQEAMRDRSRYVIDNEPDSPTFGKLISHTSVLSVFIEAIMLLSRSLNGKNLEFMADLTGEFMYASDMDRDINEKIRRV